MQLTTVQVQQNVESVRRNVENMSEQRECETMLSVAEERECNRMLRDVESVAEESVTEH